MKQKITKALKKAGEDKSGSQETRKVLVWECECGYLNAEPAIQTPENVVVCEECRGKIAWGKIPAERKS